MKTHRIVALSILLCAFSFASYSQWQQVYHGADTTNEITGIWFYSATEGFIASTHYIGYTQDGGKTFQKKYITLSNVNYNGYGVGLTFGFSASGVYAFNKDKLLVYGDYGWEPSILYSSDGGTTWKLVYHKFIRPNASQFYNTVHEMKFYSSTNGFAIQDDEIIKTNDGGQTWTTQVNYADIGFRDISFPDATTGYAASSSKVFKINISYGYWTELSNAPAGAQKISFVSPSTGYIYCVDYNGTAKYYKTTNGGISWAVCGSASLDVPRCEDMEFVNETTGFATTSGYYTYKTIDSGKSWEICKDSNGFSYLGYGFSRLFFYNQQTGWAGGYHDYLAQTTNAGGTTLPKAQFLINKSNFCSTGTVQLENYSRSDYTYQWFLNDSVFATTYNASYTADSSPWDRIKLVVSNGVDTDTAIQTTEAQVFGSFSFSTYVQSDTVCTDKPVVFLIPNSDVNTFYTIYRDNAGLATGNGNGGLLKLQFTNYGDSGTVRYAINATRTTACGVEKKTLYQNIYLYTPYITVTGQTDTVCSGIVQYVKVLNSIKGYEYWVSNPAVDGNSHIMGNGDVIQLPFRISQPHLGYHDPSDPYTTMDVQIFARQSKWGCDNMFPRTTVRMTIRDPWARLNVMNYELKTGQPITARNTSWDADYFVWNADGSGINNNNETSFEPANLSFSVPGKYKLTVFATSKQGCVDSAWNTVFVYDGNAISSNQTMQVCYTDSLRSDYFYKALDSYKDPSGNLYITGAKMKSGPGLYTKGLDGWFLIKKNRNGTVLWEKSSTISVGQGHNITESVVADNYENVYVYGHLYRDAYAPAYNVDTVSFPWGDSYAYIAKFNKKGKLLWMQKAVNWTSDPALYPNTWASPFTAGSLAMGKDNELYLKLASNYANYQFSDTIIKSLSDQTFLFHFNQDGKLLDYVKFPTRDAHSDMWTQNWDHYNHTPKMQWNTAGGLVFTAVLDSTKSLTSINGTAISFDTKKVNTALFVYDTASRKFSSILPIYKTEALQKSASLPLAFATDEIGNYYTGSYNRVKDTMQPGPSSLVFPVDLSKTTSTSYKLKTIIAKFDNNGNQLWQKLVDGLYPVGMYVMGQQLVIGGENYAPDYFKLAGHAFNSNIGEPYYYANRDTLFIGHPSAQRKKISYLSDMDGSNGKGVEGAGGVDVLLLTMDRSGNNVQLKTWGNENDDRLYSMGKDSCGNLWGIGSPDMSPNKLYYSFYSYNQPQATMMIWSMNYNNTYNSWPCFSTRPSLRLDPSIKNERCVDTMARLVWSCSNINKVNIGYSRNGGSYQLLVKDYPADSLLYIYNPKALNLSGTIQFKIEASDLSVGDTLTRFLAYNPPKKFFAKDTLVCYYDAFPLSSLAGPYRYKWNGGSWNEGIETIVPSGSSGNVGVTITDTLTGCTSYDYMNVTRKPYFAQAHIIVDSSGNERIVSTECGLRHEWRLNGTLLQDTGCILFTKDTGMYSVATVVDGCVSTVYGGSWGYYQVSTVPRRVQWIKPLVAGLQCVDSMYFVQWGSSAIVTMLNIKARRSGEINFTMLASGIDATLKQYPINLRTHNLEGNFELLIEDLSNTTIRDTMIVAAGIRQPVNLGKDTTICAGDMITLRAPLSNSLSYQWNTGATTPQIVVSPQSVQDYFVKLTTVSGCQTTDTIRITAFQAAKPYIIKDTGDVLRTVYCGKTHRWYLDGNLLQGETSCVLYIKKGGVYRVMIEDNHCRSELSDSLLITSAQKSQVTVGPNPAHDKITVSIQVPDNDRDIQIEILGDNGIRYYLKDYGAHNKGIFTTDINLSFIQTGGLYMIRTWVGTDAFIDKLIVIR